MPRKRSTRRNPYYPSEDKQFVCKHFDLPLVKNVARRKGGQIRYFGLPGEDALDLNSWGDLCEYVAAVEVFEDKFAIIKHMLRTQFRNFRHRTHLGDVDEIILSNTSEEPPSTFVSTTSNRDEGYFWDFDVLYLDYFGKFLPYSRGGRVVRNRAEALRKLFERDRQDARKSWLLMLTTESKLSSKDKTIMKDNLVDSIDGSDLETSEILEYFLDNDVDDVEQATRLIHGTLGFLIHAAANNSEVKVTPNPTVRYKGANGSPMLHFAYDIDPTGLLSGSRPALPLLRSPILQVNSAGDDRWFEILSHQPPGQTQSDLETTLGFLGDDHVRRILQNYPIGCANE